MSFYIQGGNIYAEENGRIALDTSAPMLNLIPDAAINIDEIDIEFPNLFYGLGYRQGRETFGAFDTLGCVTFAALIDQEWGPSAGSPRTLPQTLLGTVPEGTDYLDVRVRLSRIVEPNGQVLGLGLLPLVPQNQWIKLEGGSCVPEKQTGVARLFEVVRSGTNVYLRRYQSVVKDGGFTRTNPSGPEPGASNTDYFYPSTNAPNDDEKTAIIGTLIDNKASGGQHAPPGKNPDFTSNDPCSMSLSGISYRSVWRAEMKIIPGRISA